MDPKVIKTENDYDIALERFYELMHAEVKENTPEYEEMELLGILIGKYEEDHYKIPDPDPIEAIKFVMDQKGLKSKDLIGILGDRHMVYRVLKKKRRLSLDMIRRVRRELDIPYDSLLKDYDLSI